jgi:hypothetical protein
MQRRLEAIRGKQKYIASFLELHKAHKGARRLKPNPTPGPLMGAQSPSVSNKLTLVIAILRPSTDGVGLEVRIVIIVS